MFCLLFFSYCLKFGLFITLQRCSNFLMIEKNVKEFRIKKRVTLIMMDTDTKMRKNVWIEPIQFASMENVAHNKIKSKFVQTQNCVIINEFKNLWTFEIWVLVQQSVQISSICFSVHIRGLKKRDTETEKKKERESERNEHIYVKLTSHCGREGWYFCLIVNGNDKLVEVFKKKEKRKKIEIIILISMWLRIQFSCKIIYGACFDFVYEWLVKRYSNETKTVNE